MKRVIHIQEKKILEGKDEEKHHVLTSKTYKKNRQENIFFLIIEITRKGFDEDAEFKLNREGLGKTNKNKKI